MLLSPSPNDCLREEMSALQSLCCLNGSQGSCEHRARAGGVAGGLVVLRLKQHCLEAASFIQKMTTEGTCMPGMTK